MATPTNVVGSRGVASVGGTAVSVTKWTHKLDPGFVECTGTGDYDSSSGQTWKRKINTIMGAEGTLELNFDATTTNSVLVAKFTANPIVNCALILQLTQTSTYGHGNVFLTDIEVTSPVDDKVTVTCNWSNDGPFTMGS